MFACSSSSEYCVKEGKNKNLHKTFVEKKLHFNNDAEACSALFFGYLYMFYY